LYRFIWEQITRSTFSPHTYFDGLCANRFDIRKDFARGIRPNPHARSPEITHFFHADVSAARDLAKQPQALEKLGLISLGRELKFRCHVCSYLPCRDLRIFNNLGIIYVARYRF